jgi:hypothetical protein
MNDSLCLMAGCRALPYAKGLCRKHYAQAKRNRLGVTSERSGGAAMEMLTIRIPRDLGDSLRTAVEEAFPDRGVSDISREALQRGLLDMLRAKMLRRRP